MFPFGKEILAKVGFASDDEPESAAPKDSNSNDRPARTVPRRLAIAFDVSGVVCSNDNRVLPNARETIHFVQQQHIPFIFLTNSGGNTDQACAEYLGRMLNLQLSPQEVVQSHTPWLDLVPLYVDKNVLVLGRGGNALREAAHSFGFKNVILDVDLAVAYPDLFVTGKAQLQRFRQRARPLPKSSQEEPFRIHAIFVPQDPEDWALDATLIAHLLCSSKGQVGTVSHLNGRSDLPNQGYCQDDAPALYLCNLSFTERPRQPCTGVPTDGANQVSTPCRPSKSEQRPHLRRTFVETVETHFASCTGGAEMPSAFTGKPGPATLAYAEKRLRAIHDERHLEPLETVYMIGDHPWEDIFGANEFRSRHGVAWKSILVTTGVYQASARPRFLPNAIVPGIKEAVEWALSDAS